MTALADDTSVLFGGYDGDYLDDVYTLTVLGTTASWVSLTSQGDTPDLRYGHTMTVLADGTAVLFGGYNGISELNYAYTVTVPTPHPTPLATASPTLSPTLSPTPHPTPSATASPTLSPSAFGGQHPKISLILMELALVAQNGAFQHFLIFSPLSWSRRQLIVSTLRGGQLLLHVTDRCLTKRSLRAHRLGNHHMTQDMARLDAT